MASKKTNKTTFNGVDFNGIMPATKPGIVSLANTLKAMGASKDDARPIIDACFASIVADDAKGIAFITSALDGSKKVAAKAKAVLLTAKNRATLDTYNADNLDNIATVASAIDAAKIAMAQAETDLAKLQSDVTDKLDVSWVLDVSVLTGDDGIAKVYVPSDSLGSKPKAKGKSGTRTKRVYDFSASVWDKTIKTADYGTIVWDVSLEDDTFTTKLTWTHDDKPRTKTATDTNMSTAGKLCWFTMLTMFGTQPEAANKIPLNLPSTLGVPHQPAS